MATAGAGRWECVRSDDEQYQPVGRCIYCGRAGDEVVRLSDEHIVPYSLHGYWVLPEASCPECAEKTAAIEQECARSMWGAYRHASKFRTRHPKDRPSTLAVALHRGPGTERERLDVPLGEYPIKMAVVPDLEVAGILRGAPTTTEFTFYPRILNIVSDNELRREWRAQGKAYEVTRTLPITRFAQMLAKIAHCMAVARYGYGAFQPLLPRLIIGDPRDGLNLPDFVGGVSSPNPNAPRILGQPGVKVKRQIWNYVCPEPYVGADGARWLTVQMQLVHPLTPSYRVVVARL